MNSIAIKDVKAGMVVWECEDGQDACLLAITDARREDRGVSVETRDVFTGKPIRLYEAHRGGAYGPRLYREPQYTRLEKIDWTATLTALAELTQTLLQDERAQAHAREEGLQLAATQYSESCDHWKLEHTKAQAEITRLKNLLEEVGDIASQNLNGITMERRIKQVLL